MRRFPASLGEKGIDGRFGFAPDQSAGQDLRLGNHFLDGSDADLAIIELHHDIAAALEADRFAKLCRNAETPGSGDAPTYGNHVIFFELANNRVIWR